MSNRNRDNVFVEHDVPVSCGGGVDLYLVDVVCRAWTDALDAIGADVDVALLKFALVDAELSEFVVDESAGDFAVSVDGAYAGRWLSREALLADAAGTAVLVSELPRWHGLSSRIRDTALGEFRLLLDRCSTCGGDPDLQRRTEATCRRARLVATMRCTDCDVSFIEVVGA